MQWPMAAAQTCLTYTFAKKRPAKKSDTVDGSEILLTSWYGKNPVLL